jgi:hypothetical protein
MGKAIDMSHITEKFFSGMVDDPSAINRGNCFNWAMAAYVYYRARGYTVRLYADTNNDHAFIYMNGLYYDSASPRGVWDYSELETYTYFCASLALVKEHTQKEFLRRWRTEWPHTRHGKNRVWGPKFVRDVLNNKVAPKVMRPWWAC